MNEQILDYGSAISWSVGNRRKKRERATWRSDSRKFHLFHKINKFELENPLIFVLSMQRIIMKYKYTAPCNEPRIILLIRAAATTTTMAKKKNLNKFSVDFFRIFFVAFIRHETWWTNGYVYRRLYVLYHATRMHTLFWFFGCWMQSFCCILQDQKPTIKSVTRILPLLTIS